MDFGHDGRIKAGPFGLFQDVFNGTTFRLGPSTVADFDGDGKTEIAVALNKRANPDTLADPSRLIIEVYRTDGRLKWQRDLTVDRGFGQPLSAFDFDGDGAAELVVLDTQKLYILSGRDGATLFEVV